MEETPITQLDNVNVWIKAYNDELKKYLSQTTPGVMAALGAGTIYNPDALVSRKGLGIYDEMEGDDLIKPLSELKKAAIIGRPLKVSWPGASPEDLAFANYLIFEAPDRPINLMLYDALTALQYGFSVAEILFGYIDAGLYQGRIRLKNLNPLKPHYVKFSVNKFDQVNGLEYYYNPVSYKKAFHYAYMSKFNNPYGRSDWFASYRPWWNKDITIRSWSIHLERHGSPGIIGRYPKDLEKAPGGAEALDKFETMLRNLRIASYGLFPKDIFSFEFLEAKPGGNFDQAIIRHDTAIARSLMMPDNLGFTSQKFGSRALGASQKDIFELVLDFVGQTLLNQFNWQVFDPLIRYNLKTDSTPSLVFDDQEKPDFKGAGEIFDRATKGGYLSINDEQDINTVREKIGLEPIPEDKFTAWLAQRQDTNSKLADNVQTVVERVQEARSDLEEALPSENVEVMKKNLQQLDELQAEVKENMVKIITDRQAAIASGVRQASDDLDFTALRKLATEKIKLSATIRDWLETVTRQGSRDARRETL